MSSPTTQDISVSNPAQPKPMEPETPPINTPPMTRREGFRKFLKMSSFFSRTISLDETQQSPKMRFFLGQIYGHVRTSISNSFASRSSTSSLTQQASTYFELTQILFILWRTKNFSSLS